MSKNIRTLYLYIVSLISLGMIVGGFVGVASNLARYFAPDTSHYYYYDKPQEDSTYDKEKYIQEYNEWLTNEKENIKRMALKDLFTCMALLIVAVPLHTYHFKQTKKLDMKGEENNA